jgi:hypothetical protein
MDSAIDCSSDQPCALEYLEMFRHRRQRHFEWRGKLSYNARPLGQAGDERPPGSIGEGMKDHVELLVG